MGNQTNNPHGNQNDQQQHSKERQRDDDMSKRGGSIGKDQMGKDKGQKHRDDRSGNQTGSDRSRSGSQDR